MHACMVPIKGLNRIVKSSGYGAWILGVRHASYLLRIMITGKKVRIYYNKNAKDYTVQEYIKGTGWRKMLATKDALLHDVTFKVSEAGRQRCIEQGKRNVHAYAEGILRRLDKMQYAHFVGWTPIRYNPYKGGTFMANGEPVYGAESVVFSTWHGVQGWGLLC